MAINGSVEKVMGSTKSAQHLVTTNSVSNIRLPDTLVITYLQMTDWDQFCPAYLNYLDGIKLMCIARPDVAFYRFLYTSVGEQWRWRDRLSQADEELCSSTITIAGASSSSIATEN